MEGGRICWLWKIHGLLSVRRSIGFITFLHVVTFWIILVLVAISLGSMIFPHQSHDENLYTWILIKKTEMNTQSLNKAENGNCSFSSYKNWIAKNCLGYLKFNAPIRLQFWFLDRLQSDNLLKFFWIFEFYNENLWNREIFVNCTTIIWPKIKL